MLRLIGGSLVVLAASGFVATRTASAPARFDWFEYAGHDSIYDTHKAGANDYVNPILAGFYPDPSITRGEGDNFYLVNSTFAYFPGIPVFHSKDLVSWTQIGNVIDRPSQLRFDSLGVSRGVFAPAITYHAGTFYLINTCVDCRGNFMMTATNPAGPWSDPIWLGFDGIDPSMFFDDDGRAYIVNNGPPIGTPLYSGHRAIWIQEFDTKALKLIGERTLIVNGGVDINTKPSWIEGPHVLKRNGKYFLIAAEGGTGDYHSEVVFGADNVRGPFTPWSGNPILTQRHLDRNRPDPITSTGHADFVTTTAGGTWAVFLATRPYANDTYNTGRETFLMKVNWRDDGWPVITSGQEGVPYVASRPNLPKQPAPKISTHGNFTVRDDFSSKTLAPYWLQLRTPREKVVDLTTTPGWLSLPARPVSLSSRGQPSFVGRRQQHLNATATTAMRFAPERDGDRAGLVAFQSENNWYWLAVGRADGKRVVQVIERGWRDAGRPDSVLATASLPNTNETVYLRVVARRGKYDFLYGTSPNRWTTLVKDADGTVLSTKAAGGFVGTLFALHAYGQ